jgi:hypothetical protein
MSNIFSLVSDEIDMVKTDCTFESVNILNPSNINHSFFPQPLASYGTEMFVVIPQIDENEVSCKTRHTS